VESLSPRRRSADPTISSSWTEASANWSPRRPFASNLHGRPLARYGLQGHALNMASMANFLKSSCILSGRASM
jgi:hypothetical protein